MDGLEGARNPWLDGNYKAVDGSSDLLIVGGEKERGRKTFWRKMAPSWCSRIKSLLGIRTWVWITHGGRSTVGCKGWRSTNHNKVWSGLDDWSGWLRDWLGSGKITWVEVLAHLNLLRWSMTMLSQLKRMSVSGYDTTASFGTGPNRDDNFWPLPDRTNYTCPRK